MNSEEHLGKGHSFPSSPWPVLLAAAIVLVVLIAVEASWPKAASEIGRAFGWPLALVAIALIFRKTISSLLNRISKFEYGPAKLEIDKHMEPVREFATDGGRAESDPVGQPGSINPVRRRTERDLWKELAVKVPAAAIVESWTWLRQELEGAYSRLEGDTAPAGYVTTPQILRRLVAAGVVRGDEEKAIYSMFRLRNNCAHKAPSSLAVTAQQAIDYLSAAENLSQTIATRSVP